MQSVQREQRRAGLEDAQRAPAEFQAAGEGQPGAAGRAPGASGRGTGARASEGGARGAIFNFLQSFPTSHQEKVLLVQVAKVIRVPLAGLLALADAEPEPKSQRMETAASKCYTMLSLFLVACENLWYSYGIELKSGDNRA